MTPKENNKRFARAVISISFFASSFVVVGIGLEISKCKARFGIFFAFHLTPMKSVAANYRT